MDITEILKRNGIYRKAEKSASSRISFSESYKNFILYKKYDISLENSNIKSGINELINNKLSIMGEAQNVIDDLKEVGRDAKRIALSLWNFIKELFKKFIAWIKKTRYDMKMKKYKKTLKFIIKTVNTSDISKFDLPRWATDPVKVNELKEEIERLYALEDKFFKTMADTFKGNNIMNLEKAEELRDQADDMSPILSTLDFMIGKLDTEMITFTEESDDKLSSIRQTCDELLRLLVSMADSKSDDKRFVVAKISTDMIKYMETTKPENVSAEEAKKIGANLQLAMNIVKTFLTEEDKIMRTIIQGWMKITKKTPEYDETKNPGEAPTGYVKNWSKDKMKREDRKKEKDLIKELRKEAKKNRKKDIVLGTADFVD